MRRPKARLDLQAKISFILAAVIVPTSLIVTVVEHKLTRPLMEEEMRQVGITTAKTLAAEIVSGKLLNATDPTPAIESRIQELLYSQPNLIRVDVVAKHPVTGAPRTVATNIEEDPGVDVSPPAALVEHVTTNLEKDEEGIGFWEVAVPIEQVSRDLKGPRKNLGSVHVVVSMRLIGRMAGTLWKVTAGAAALSMIVLFLVLSYLLRKTIANDRKLRLAESQNQHLTGQLHDLQRQLMNTEKLAVMGQLTGSFAHEIGTPLNAISGHLQLLDEEVSPKTRERVEIIHGQVAKITEIVKSFLQSTSKPITQKQLADLNLLADKTLSLLRPRMESLGVEVRRDFDRAMGPVRVVPLEVEQILLNLLNNSLDALKEKRAQGTARLQLEVATGVRSEEGRDWAEISVYDTGEGIPKDDLKNVMKPFFTTKLPGEGTGLGLSICNQLARRYGGMIDVDSKEGAWTRVTVRIPHLPAEVTA